jgi:hypothetical protein
MPRRRQVAGVIGPTSTVNAPPVERGRLVYDFEIPELYFGGLPKITDKVRWVRAHLPREKCIKVGRDSAWYEADIEDHIRSLRGANVA